MKRRGILLVLAVLAVSGGLMVHRRKLEAAKPARALAEMLAFRDGVGIYYSPIVRPMPESLDDLRGPMLTDYGDLGNDPWGRGYEISIIGTTSATVTCFGADGAPGGEGAAADIVVELPPAKARPPR